MSYFTSRDQVPESKKDALKLDRRMFILDVLDEQVSGFLNSSCAREDGVRDLASPRVLAWTKIGVFYCHYAH